MMRKRGEQSTQEVEKLVSVPNRKAKPKPKSSRHFFIHSILAIVFVLYVVVPLSVYFCPSVRRHAVFLNYVSLSRQKNLSVPAESGLACTRHFYITSGDDVRLGVWHVPPHSVLPRCRGDFLPAEEEFADGRPVFLYLHGNAGTRSGNHRVQLYQLLSERLDAHVLAFDYRGFGDSSNVSPTEKGVVQDTHHVFQWLSRRVQPSRIFVWGHSLGTGVGVAFMEMLSRTGNRPGPAGLILEAPFTKIFDAARYHPITIFHRYMPFFELLIATPIGDEDTGFDSLSRIDSVESPILILHAEDDGFVPFDHSKKLYDKAVAARPSERTSEVQFVAFDGKLDLGHKYICRSPDLPNIISKFIGGINPKLI